MRSGVLISIGTAGQVGGLRLCRCRRRRRGILEGMAGVGRWVYGLSGSEECRERLLVEVDAVLTLVCSV